MGRSLRLAVIGDPHVAVPRDDPDPRLEVDPGRKLHGLSVELLRATVQAVHRHTVDAALVLGDLTRDSELFNHEQALAVLSELKAPYYLVTGNHDLIRQRTDDVTYPDTERLDRRELCEFYRDRGLPDGMTRYVVELEGGVALIVMDSNRTLAELADAGESLKRQDDGWLGEQQLGWLEGVLDQCTKGQRLPLIALHHSIVEHSPAEQPGHMLYRIFRYWKLHDADKLLGVLSRYQVPLVLSGHLHAQSINSTNDTYNLVTSATVSYPHAWRLLTFTDRVAHVESHRITSIPSVPDLAEQSLQWMGEGMAELIKEKAGSYPMVGSLAGKLADAVTGSRWWTRFCDGTLAGFSREDFQKPAVNGLGNVVTKQLLATMADYGTWKSLRPDPNQLEIPL